MSEEHPETQEPTEAPPSTAPSETPLSDEAWAVASSRWINDCVRNSPISASTEAWNHLGSVLHHLRNMLREEMRKV